jgi:hypothetical protein
VILALILAGIISYGLYALVSTLNAPAVPPVSMFDTSNIGTQQAADALAFARDNGVSGIIPYDLNPANYPLAPGQALPAPVATELGWAQSARVQLWPVFEGQLGGDTTQEVAANDQAVANAVRVLDGNAAIGGYFIDDEKPADPGQPDTQHWLDALQHRCVQMRTLTTKPLLGTMTWGDNLAADNYPRLRFLEEVHAACPEMTLSIDYYPVPQSPTSVSRYGPISDIQEKINGRSDVMGGVQQIGATLNAVAGLHTAFVAQTFGWGKAHQADGGPLGFPPNAGPPNADLMAWMMRAAVYGEGRGGVGQIILFSYGDAVQSGGQGQVDEMARAITAFQANP